MPGGRPKQALDLEEGWQQRILGLYAEGGSDVEVKALIYKERGSFSNDLWDRWLKDEPEFSETVKKGRELCEAWWLELGRKGATGKSKINPTTWIFNMKNRFGWADRREVEHSGRVHQTHEHRAVSEVDSRANEMLGHGEDTDRPPALPH